MRGWLRLIKKARISRRPTSYKWQTFFVCGVVCHKSTLCKKNLQQFCLFFVNFLDVFLKLCQTPNTLEFCTVCIPRNQVQHGTERVYNINIESPKLSPDVPLFHVQFLFALRQHWTSHIFSIQGPLFSIYIYIHIHTSYIHIHIFLYTYFGRAISRNVFDFPINSSAFGGWICKAMNKIRQTSKKRTMTYFWGMDDGSIFGGWMMDLMFLLIPKKMDSSKITTRKPAQLLRSGSPRWARQRTLDLGLRALRCRCAVCNPFCPSSSSRNGD